MRVGELARATGFTGKTLRYYDEIGLVQPRERSAAGYRLYSDDAVERLRFVRTAQGLGLSLADIQTVLDISDAGKAPCSHMMTIVDRELERIQVQMASLEEMREQFQHAKARIATARTSAPAADRQGCPCLGDNRQPGAETGRS